MPKRSERTQEDGELLERAARGDEAAFAAWTMRHRDALTRTARGLLGRGAGHEAEDVVQDTLLNAYRAIAAGKRPEHPRAWLFAILRNCCADRRRTHTFTDALPDDAHSASDTVGSFEQRESVEGLLRAIGELPRRQREIVVDREFNGRSYADLADRHGISVSAVKSSLVRARRNLAASRAGQILVAPIAALSQRAATLAPTDGDAVAAKVAAGGLGLFAKILTTTAVTGGIVLALPAAHPGTGSASGIPPDRRGSDVAVVATSRPGHTRPAGHRGRHQVAPPTQPATLSPAAQTRAAHRAVDDCVAGRPVGRRYTVATLQQARDHLPVDLSEYTGCDQTLQRAILAAAVGG